MTSLPLGKPGYQTVSTRHINVAMLHLKIADKNLSEGRGSVTPHAPVKIAYNVDTGKFSLSDGYHRYLKLRGGSLSSALEQSKNNIFPDIPTSVTLTKNLDIGVFGHKEVPLTDDEVEAYTSIMFGQQNRIERAAKQGFDINRIWYHGSTPDFGADSSDITSFDHNVVGRNYGSGEVGFCFTSNPKEADIYASNNAIGNRVDGGAVYPVYIASKKTFVVDDNQALIMGIDKPSEVGNTNIWDDHKEEIIKQSGDADTIIIFDKDSGDRMLVAFEPKNIRSIHSTFLHEHLNNQNLLGCNLNIVTNPKPPAEEKPFPTHLKLLSDKVSELLLNNRQLSSAGVAKLIISESQTFLKAPFSWSRDDKLALFGAHDFKPSKGVDIKQLSEAIVLDIDEITKNGVGVAPKPKPATSFEESKPVSNVPRI